MRFVHVVKIGHSVDTNIYSFFIDSIIPNLFGLNVMGKFRPVIVYDGECRFCLWSVGRIRRFEYLPRQADGMEERFPVLARSDFNTGLRLICADGQVDVGADAVYQIYR